MSKATICVGIVAYDGFDGQVAQDYMRLMFHLGRRHTDYDFQLAIKWKSEQFRARNAIVKAALQNSADYIWMLDDDHILDIGRSQGASHSYDLPIKLVKHLEENPAIGVVGALYFQRGGDYAPVIMQESRDDNRPYFLTHPEISYRMQKVDITGGGCMMIRASVFDKIEEPWFKPEHEWGTDVQLCKQVRAAGFQVWCDTSLEIGHMQNEKRLVTSEVIKHDTSTREYEPLLRYKRDVLEYLKMNIGEAKELACEYDTTEINSFKDSKQDLAGYYATRGKAQIARQLVYHHYSAVIEEMKLFHSKIRMDMKAYGAEYGCGSAPVSFEFALHGHKMDFIDVEGCAALEFTKWRAAKHKVDAGFKLTGPYDYVLMLDSIEHIADWRTTLSEVISRIKVGGVLATNYFSNRDFNNPEHVSMDHEAVRRFLVGNGMQSDSKVFWVKQQISQEEAA
jgi:2-polyprenyl-3-methyl-5-hydroxy-6-metoxy-1,4-benzoquinol methylase